MGFSLRTNVKVINLTINKDMQFNSICKKITLNQGFVSINANQFKGEQPENRKRRLIVKNWFTRAVTLILPLSMVSFVQADTLRVTVAEYSAKTGPYFEEAAAAFEQANPDHKVQIEVVPWDVLQQKLTTDISGNANADLSIIGTRWLIDFVSEGIASPLDDYMRDEFKARFFPAFLSPSNLEGKTYGLPVAASARAMYYNQDLLDKAGIASAPDTWDELVDAATKISALGDDVYGFGMQGKEIETDVYYYYAL